jgi:DNA-binding response OmpR family regulator
VSSGRSVSAVSVFATPGTRFLKLIISVLRMGGRDYISLTFLPNELLAVAATVRSFRSSSNIAADRWQHNFNPL